MADGVTSGEISASQAEEVGLPALDDMAAASPGDQVATPGGFIPQVHAYGAPGGGKCSAADMRNGAAFASISLAVAQGFAPTHHRNDIVFNVSATSTVNLGGPKL
jgi:hypothetical protein